MYSILFFFVFPSPNYQIWRKRKWIYFYWFIFTFRFSVKSTERFRHQICMHRVKQRHIHISIEELQKLSDAVLETACEYSGLGLYDRSNQLISNTHTQKFSYSLYVLCHRRTNIVLRSKAQYRSGGTRPLQIGRGLLKLRLHWQRHALVSFTARTMTVNGIVSTKL